MRKNTRGLGMIELLLGITMSALIFLVSTSLITTLFRSDTKSRSSQSIDQAKNDIMSELATRIRWAESVTFDGAHLVVDSVSYRIEGGRMYRGDDPLTPREVTIDGWEVSNYSLVDSLASYEIEIAMHHTTATSLTDSLRLVVSQRQTQIDETGS